jgi:hypothetical protein
MKIYDASNYTNSFMHQVQIAYKGNTNAPAPGADPFQKYLAIANRLKNVWAQDADILWNSLFDTREYGPVQAANQEYDLDSDVFFVSDGVSIVRLDGNIDWFRVVQPKARNDESSSRPDHGIGMSGGDFGMPLVYIKGSSANQGSNLTLVFVDPFTATSLDVGGTISVGVYTLPDDFKNSSDIVVVDDPYWLVYATASELARNDPAKQDQVPNLSGLANAAYGKMITLNQGNSFEQPNGPRYMLRQPGVTWEQF